MALHGVQVSLRRNDDTEFDFPNPYQRCHSDFEGYFRSRLIAVPPNASVEIVITFNEKVWRFTESGTFVNVTCGSYSQSFWIDYRDVDLARSQIIRRFKLWDSADDNADYQLLDIVAPQPDPLATEATAEWIQTPSFTVNEGCVAVWVQRGRLNAHGDDAQTYEWATTDPPRPWRHIVSKSPKVIRGHWFQPLKSDNGYPYLIEFRNNDLDETEAEERSCAESREDSYFDCHVPQLSEESSDDTSDEDSDAYRNDSDYQPPRRRRKRKRGQDASSIREMLADTIETADAGDDDVESSPVLQRGSTILRLSKLPRPDREISSNFVKREPTAERSSSTPRHVLAPKSSKLRPSIVARDRDRISTQYTIDLTSDSAHDTKYRELSSHVEQSNFPAAAQAVADAEDSDVDLEDLEDEYKAVKLRRAIRAAKKRRAAKGKAT